MAWFRRSRSRNRSRSGIRSRHVHHKTRLPLQHYPNHPQLFPLHFTIPHKIQIWGEILVQNFRAGTIFEPLQQGCISIVKHNGKRPMLRQKPGSLDRQWRLLIAPALLHQIRHHCSKEVGPRPGIPPDRFREGDVFRGCHHN